MDSKIEITEEMIGYLVEAPILHLTLRKEPFFQIKEGKKIVEERNYNEYWMARFKKFLNLEGFLINFKWGYKKDAENFYSICGFVGCNFDGWEKTKEEISEILIRKDLLFLLELINHTNVLEYENIIKEILDKKNKIK